MYSREFSNNTILQWSLGALVFAYFIAFYGFIRNSVVTQSAYEGFRHICPPYFQSCGDFYFLEALPYGYSQTILYMIFFGILAWCVYLISQKEWREVQLNLIPVFLWHGLNVLVLTDQQSGNYEYYLISFGLVLLFFPHKEFFLKLTLVVFYVLSTVAKIHPSWIEGGYFTALKTGLPLFPDWSIPIWTNLIIVMEMIGAWFLMSKNLFLQRTVLIFFVVFHLYSGILVEYRYPATVLPFILIAFGPWYQYTKPPLDRKSLVGWSFVALLFIFQFLPKMIEGDEKMTLEGNKYGLYMFEANHQCISEATIYYKDGTTESSNREALSARNRCSPYNRWFQFNQMCRRLPNIDRIKWTFDHSVNGGPFYRIVETGDVCSLKYHAFKHNSWIRSPEESQIIGYPVQNFYY